MTLDLVLEIADLAVSLTKTQTSGDVQQKATVAGILLQIIHKSVQAYEDHTGQKLDPSLIKPELLL